MAETFLSAVIRKLVDLLADEVKSMKGIQREVKSLQRELEIIEPFLKDAEAKLCRGEASDASKIWMKQLREEAERIEDVVDQYLYSVDQGSIQGGFVGSIYKAGRCVKALKPRHDLASKIRDIKKSLREIKDRGESYGLRHFEQGGSSGTAVDAAIDPRIGSLFIDDDELVGIDSTSTDLVQQIVDGPSTRSVISLVGEGGIGKTTLAKKVYDELVTKDHFDCHAWITVSQSCNLITILRRMKNQLSGQAMGDITSPEELIEVLRRSLQKKRYVIVFDDVWQTDFWGVMKNALPNKGNRSRIVITTRNVTVVDSFKETTSDTVLHLKPWPTNQGWELFCKKAFSNELEKCCPPGLRKLSLEILSKCQGLPLAIGVIAGLLSKKEKSELEWRELLDNLTTKFKGNHELSSISNILLLSYLNLPYHLKLCFLYFGIFPEDYLIPKTRLYSLWIAEGFIKSRSDKTPKQIAEENLKELINRNMVSESIEYCKVHDLLREMILEIFDDSSFCQIIKENALTLKCRSRRLSIHGKTEKVFETVDHSKLHCLLLFDMKEFSDSFINVVFTECKLLKVLDFTGTSLNNLPKEVGNLCHLKYLSLLNTNVKYLPKSIGKLKNLESLYISGTLVRELPVEINKLKKLRVLVAFVYDKESQYSLSSHLAVRMHEGVGNLEELQILIGVQAYPGRVGFMKEIRKLSKLIMLGISKLTADMVKALGDAIENMNHLEYLTLNAADENEVLDLTCISRPPILLHTLRLVCQLKQFPRWILELRNLHELKLQFSRLAEEPLKYLKDIPNLSSLLLFDAYDGQELHITEGSFKKLKVLVLRKLIALKVLKIDKGSLPILERLIIGPSPLMKNVPFGIKHLTFLKYLRIIDMPKEFVSALQPNCGSDHWIINHVPAVKFWYYKRGIDEYAKYNLGSSRLLERLRKETESLSNAVSNECA